MFTECNKNYIIQITFTFPLTYVSVAEIFENGSEFFILLICNVKKQYF